MKPPYIDTLPIWSRGMYGYGIVDWDVPDVGWGVVVSIVSGSGRDVLRLVGSSETDAWFYDASRDAFVSKPVDYDAHPGSLIVDHFALQADLVAVDAHLVTDTPPQKVDMVYKLQ